MVKRTTLLGHSGSDVEAYSIESAVMKDVRNSQLIEFKRVYVNARREFAWQNTMDGLGLVRNVVGAIGNQLSVPAGYRGNNHLNGIGNLLSEIAADIITTHPWISLAVSKLNARLAENQIKRELPNSPTIELVQQSLSDHLHRLNELKNSSNNLTVLNAQRDLLSCQLDLAAREGADIKNRIKLQLLRNSVYGPTKAANSLLGIIDGYDADLELPKGIAFPQQEI